MNEEELNEAIEELKKATQDYHKMSENCLYFDEHQYNRLMNLSYKLENELKQEKEKNKKLEEQRNELAMILSDKEDERVELNKVIDMMAEDIVKVPENDYMSETQLSVIHLINLHIEERKEHIKKYYFNKVKENEK